MQNLTRIFWICVASTVIVASSTPVMAITQFVIQNATSAYTFNQTQTCFFLNEITVGGSPVYNAILDSSGNAPIWKVVFLERNETSSPGSLRNHEFTSTEYSPTSVSQAGDLITITWQNCGDATYHFNVIAVVAMQDNGVYSTIEVQNSTQDSGDIFYRLMEVHFPYVILGPSSFETPPDSGDDRLSMNTYVLESPAENIVPTLPYPAATPGQNPIEKNSWNTDFGKGNARYPFNLYYKNDCLNSTEAACGFYFAVYNSYGYPCQINFAKNIDPDYSDDSFFYDVVMYPHGYDIIDTAQNDFTMPPGLGIELFTPMKGNWYDAAQRYRSQTDLLSVAMATPPGPTTPTPVPPEFTVTPIWHTTPIHANNKIPSYLKTASIIYYVSPQVSDYDFCVNGQYPVADQARRLKDYLFTQQSPSVLARIQVISQFPVISWPMLFQGAQTNPLFAPEWAGGHYPITTQSLYNTHCRAHTSELAAIIQEGGTPTPGATPPLNLKFMAACGGFMYHWNGEHPSWQEHPLFGIAPTPTPPGFVSLRNYGCEINPEWGGNYIGSIQDSLPRKAFNTVGLCSGSPDNMAVMWNTTNPRGIMNTIMDQRNGSSSFIGADIAYHGWSIRYCLGDYTCEEAHGHPRNGSNYLLSAWQKYYRDFHNQYDPANQTKGILLEDPNHAHLGSCDIYHAAFFPAIDPGSVQEPSPSGLGLGKTLKYLLVNTNSDYIKHVPIAQIIAHDRIPMFDGMSGYITGTQFHPEYGPTLYTGYRYNFYLQPEPTPGVTPTDPFRPIRSLNADLAYSYVSGNRMLIMDVDQPVDASGTPLPTLTPTPTGTLPVSPAVTPTPPQCAYSFLDEPSVSSSRQFLKTLITSYVFYANQQSSDELYKTLFSGRMLRAPEIQTLLTPVSIAYDNGTGKPDDPVYDAMFTYELTSSPVLTSAWRSPANLPEFVVLSFVNFESATKTILTKSMDITSYFTPNPGTNYVYKRVLYHDPSTSGTIVNISNPQQFTLSVQIPSRSTRNYKIFRVAQLGKDADETWMEGDYINWNGDEYIDKIDLKDGILSVQPGIADGIVSEPLILAEDIVDFTAWDVTGDTQTDLVCLTQNELLVFGGDEKSPIVQHSLSPKSEGSPIQIIMNETNIENTIFRVISEQSVIDITIQTETLELDETVRLNLPGSTVTRCLNGYLNSDESLDWLMQTNDGDLLIIGEDDSGVRIFDEKLLGSDVSIQEINDIDLDSDADVVLESNGKKLSGTPLYFKNQGEWKFQ